MESTHELSARYDEVAPTYEAAKGTTDAQRLYWITYEHLTWKPVEALLPPPGTPFRILDAGGGSGKYGVQMAARGHQVTVLDLSPKMLERARAKFAAAGVVAQGSFVVGNIVDLAFPDESFDLVFCEGDPVSYCLDDYPRAIAELVRVAKRAAPVVLGVDNRHDRFIGEIHFGDPKKALEILLTGRAKCPYGMPIHAFTLPELEAAVRDAGAVVDEIFGKPVLFYELVAALQAARGPDFDLMGARDEILALEERMVREGYAVTGGHFQVMARRRP